MLARVLPPALDAHDVEPALLRVVAVDVGDLELAPARRLEPLDQVEHVRREAVEADDGVARRRLAVARVDDAGLLDDVGHPRVAVVDDDAEVLGVGDLLDEDHRAVVGGVPPRDRLRLRALEDVVAEHDDELLAAGEVAGHAHDLRDPARPRLHLVRQVEREEGLPGAALVEVAVTEQVDHLPRVALARHDEDVLEARALRGAGAGSRSSASGRRAAGACSRPGSARRGGSPRRRRTRGPS